MLASDEGEAEGGGSLELGVDEVEDLGGDEGGDGDLFGSKPVLKLERVPSGWVAGEAAFCEGGAMGEAVAADMEFRQSKAPGINLRAVEVFVDSLGAPIEPFLRVDNPFWMAGGSAGGEEEAL